VLIQSERQAVRLSGAATKYASIIFRTRVANITTVKWPIPFCFSTMPADCHDPEWAIDFDLIRCTENTALTAWEWFGEGDKNQASLAATDAIHSMFE